MQDLILVEPTTDLAEEFMTYVSSFDDAVINGSGFHYAASVTSASETISKLHGYARGEGLPDGWVPSSTFWAVEGRQIVGMITLRHFLNERLEKIGGHVGYSVHPSHRGRGLASKMLKMILPKAREMGLRRLLLVCEKSNEASARVMEKNGADSLVESQSEDGIVTQYRWIGL